MACEFRRKLEELVDPRAGRVAFNGTLDFSEEPWVNDTSCRLKGPVKQLGRDAQRIGQSQSILCRSKTQEFLSSANGKGLCEFRADFSRKLRNQAQLVTVLRHTKNLL